MTNIDITFNADEQITKSFEQACADIGMTVSAGINILIRTALRERGLLFGTVDDSLIEKTAFQQQQRKAVYEFIESNHAIENGLTADDFAEFDSGKYKINLNLKEITL